MGSPPPSSSSSPSSPVPNGGDPPRPRRQRQPRQAGHQPAGAANESRSIGRIVRHVHRRTVSRHDGVEVLEEAAGILLDRQHGLLLTLRGPPRASSQLPAKVAPQTNM